MNKIKLLIILIFPIVFLCGCNYNPIDLDYYYDKAICNYDGDKFELKIDSWNDYEGEQIQILSNGNVYLISANHCYLVSKGDEK